MPKTCSSSAEEIRLEFSWRKHFWKNISKAKFYPAKRKLFILRVFVCLLAEFLINYWSDFDEIW